MLVLFSSPAENARYVAERIRGDVENNEFIAGDKRLKITVSVGIASFPVEGVETTDDLMRRADSALYPAKGAGRNLVCVS